MSRGLIDSNMVFLFFFWQQHSRPRKDFAYLKMQYLNSVLMSDGDFNNLARYPINMSEFFQHSRALTKTRNTIFCRQKSKTSKTLFFLGPEDASSTKKYICTIFDSCKSVCGRHCLIPWIHSPSPCVRLWHSSAEFWRVESQTSSSQQCHVTQWYELQTREQNLRRAGRKKDSFLLTELVLLKSLVMTISWAWSIIYFSIHYGRTSNMAWT